jgi:hypothetical protein
MRPSQEHGIVVGIRECVFNNSFRPNTTPPDTLRITLSLLFLIQTTVVQNRRPHTIIEQPYNEDVLLSFMHSA